MHQHPLPNPKVDSEARARVRWRATDTRRSRRSRRHAGSTITDLVVGATAVVTGSQPSPTCCWATATIVGTAKAETIIGIPGNDDAFDGGARPNVIDRGRGKYTCNGRGGLGTAFRCQ